MKRATFLAALLVALTACQDQTPGPITGPDGPQAAAAPTQHSTTSMACFQAPTPGAPASCTGGGIFEQRRGLSLLVCELNRAGDCRIYKSSFHSDVGLPRIRVNRSDGYYKVKFDAAVQGYDPSKRHRMIVFADGLELGRHETDAPMPTSGEAEIRFRVEALPVSVVLTWGEQPWDLDAHLTGPTASPATRFHVWYGNRGLLTGPPFAALDVDDVSSFGPETITIRSVLGGTYRYSVHDYTDRALQPSNALANSGAKVEVYRGANLVATFDVPNVPGTLWTVFEMNGPIITPVNSMTYESNPSLIQSATDAATIRAATRGAPK